MAQAQATGSGIFQTGVPLASCASPRIGTTIYCATLDAGLQWSQNGAAFSQIGAPAAGGVISINGKSGALTITATSTAPAVSSVAPTITVNAQ